MSRDEALAILDAAVDRAMDERVDTPEVRAALKALLPSCERRFLDWFWESAGYGEPIGRSQNVNAALRGIRRSGL